MARRSKTLRAGEVIWDAKAKAKKGKRVRAKVRTDEEREESRI